MESLFKNHLLEVTDSSSIFNGSEAIPLGEIERFNAYWKLWKTPSQVLVAGLKDDEYYLQHNLELAVYLRGKTFAMKRTVGRFYKHDIERFNG